MKSAAAWLLPLLLLSACGGNGEPSGYLGAPTGVWAERLRSADHGVRDPAIRQLGEVRADVVPVLRPLLMDSDARVRAGARESVTRILHACRKDDPARLEPFLPLFADLSGSHDEASRDLGLRGIRALGPMAQSGLTATRRWLAHDRPEVALAAAETVLAVEPGDSAAILTVAAALLPTGTREAAARLLTAHADGALPVLIESLRAVDVDRRNAALPGLSLLAGKAVSAKPTLLAMLGTEDEALRLRVAHTLTRVDPGNAEAVGALGNLLRDSDEHRAPAARVLAGLGGPGVNVLRGALSADTPLARIIAARCLILLGQEADRPIAVLTDALGGDDVAAAGAAYDVLYELCERAAPAVPALLRLLAAGTMDQRIDAADLLGRIGPPARTALPALRKLLTSDDDDLRVTVELSIARIISD